MNNSEPTPQERMTRSRLFVGLDQKDMAALLRRSRSTISSWERGVQEPPMSALAAWAQITGRSIDWIVWGDSGMPARRELVAANAERPAEAGRSEGDVRPKGLEPLTFWLGAETLHERTLAACLLLVPALLEAVRS